MNNSIIKKLMSLGYHKTHSGQVVHVYEPVKIYCKNCIHWNRHKKDDYGGCNSDKFVDGGDGYGLNLAPKDVLLYCSDSGYGTFFVTKEEFGCRYFKFNQK